MSTSRRISKCRPLQQERWRESHGKKIPIVRSKTAVGPSLHTITLAIVHYNGVRIEMNRSLIEHDGNFINDPRSSWQNIVTVFKCDSNSIT